MGRSSDTSWTSTVRPSLRFFLQEWEPFYRCLVIPMNGQMRVISDVNSTYLIISAPYRSRFDAMFPPRIREVIDLDNLSKSFLDLCQNITNPISLCTNARCWSVIQLEIRSGIRVGTPVCIKLAFISSSEEDKAGYKRHVNPLMDFIFYSIVFFFS